DKSGEGVMLKAVAKAMEPVDREESLDHVRPHYLETLTLVERLHRRLLDVIKDEFDRRSRADINSVQALLLYNIGEKDLTAGELRTRGYYLGSNVSYNLKKLVEMGYLDHQRSRIDRRSVRIKLTDKGREVRDIVDTLYQKHVATVAQVGGIDCDDVAALNKSLQRLERFWTDQILYRLASPFRCRPPAPARCRGVPFFADLLQPIARATTRKSSPRRATLPTLAPLLECAARRNANDHHESDCGSPARGRRRLSCRGPDRRRFSIAAGKAAGSVCRGGSDRRRCALHRRSPVGAVGRPVGGDREPPGCRHHPGDRGPR